MPEKHSYPIPGGRAYWLTERLWAAADGLPTRQVPIAGIAEFEMDCWFRGRHPSSCRAVVDHAGRIFNADLAYPVILAADGHLMDGGHRIAKAWLEGLKEVNAVRFEITPPPDWIDADPPED